MKTKLVVASGVLGIAGFLCYSTSQGPVTESMARESVAPDSAPSAPQLETPAGGGLAAGQRRAPPELPPREPARTQRRFYGVVTDPAGGPVEGALVAIKYKLGNYWTAPALGESTSDAAGRFEILVSPAELGVEESFVCQVMAWGSPHSVDRVLPEKEISVRVSWVSVLTGFVRDAETGEPVTGVTLRCQDLEVVSEADGAYRLAGVRVGQPVMLRAAKNGYVPLDTIATITDRVEERLDLELQRGVALRCRIQDADGGDAISGAMIRAHMQGDVIAVTDTEGIATLRVDKHGRFRLAFEAEGYCPLEWSAEARMIEELTVIPLIRLGRIEVHAHGQDGTPLPASSAYASCAEHPFLQHPVPGGPPGQSHWVIPPYWTGEPRGEGVAIAVVPCSSLYAVHIRVEGYAPARAEVLVNTPGQECRLDATLFRGGRVHGTVTLNGQPWPPDGSEVLLRHQDGTIAQRAEIGPDGRYDATEAPPGRLELLVLDDFRPHQDGVWIDLEDGEEVVHDFAIEAATGTIVGRVTSTTGLAVPDVSISAWGHAPDGSRHYQTKTAEDGSYSLDVESGLAYSVRAFRPPVWRSREQVSAGATGIDFTLPELGELTLRLVDAETRKPVPLGFELHVLHWREEGSEAFLSIHPPHRTSAEPTFPMPIGKVDIRVHWATAGYLPVTVQGIQVGHEAGQPVEVALERGMDLDLRFTGPESAASWWHEHLIFVLEESQAGHVNGPFPSQGGPSNMRINGINVWIESTSLVHQLAYPEEDGVAPLRGLAPGRYTIVAIPDDFVFEPASFDLSGELSQPVDVRWRRR